MVRVVYVIDSVSRVGGAEQGLVAMAPLLVRAGVELHVAFLKLSLIHISEPTRPY